MKILHISASYKPAFIYGGPIMSVSILAEQLVKAGIQADVFTTTANGANELRVVTNTPVMVDGVSTTYFKRVTKDHTHFSPALLSHLWKNAKDYDVIHIHAWWNLVSVLACLVTIRRGVQVVVSPRGTLSNYSFNNKNNRVKGLIHNYLTVPLLKKCFIHTTSGNEYRAITEIIQTKHVFNIPNFITLPDSRQYAALPHNETLKLIFLSRIEEKKGLDILLNALKTVTIPYTLTIAGDGAPGYVDHLKSVALANNIADKISWIGFQINNKFDLLHQHDLLVLPSHDENFGNVVIESLSIGTPVLISKNVGLADYVEQNNMGWICQANATSVSNAINETGRQKDRFEAIRKNAPAKISEDFDYKNLVEKYIDMYHQITAHE